MASEQENIRDSVQRLSREVGELVIQEHQILNGEMNRMSTILHEAAVDLRACFNAMSNQISQQSASLRASMLLNQAEGGGDELQSLLSNTSQISAHVSTAVRALQFEDIAQQLLKHACHRIDSIEAMFTVLRTKIDTLGQTPAPDPLTVINTLLECRLEISRIREALSLSNPVKQESLTKGDVTMF